MADNRYILIETRSRISRYKLRKDCDIMVRVRRGLYRTDNILMVPDRSRKSEMVAYHLGHTQPRGHGFLVESKYTMAHIRIMQLSKKKTGILDGFNMKYLTYGLIVFAVVFGIAGSLLS